LVQFNSIVKPCYTAINLAEVEDLCTRDYPTDGYTALLDAVGKTVYNTGVRLNKLPVDERPDRVLILIITDGEENSSTEWGSQQVNNTIKHQQNKYSWEFQFIGSNIDAIAASSWLGIKDGKALTYSSSSKGTNTAFKIAASNVRSYRQADSHEAGTSSACYTQQDQVDAMQT